MLLIDEILPTILAEICTKMRYFHGKIAKISLPKRICPQTALPPAAGGAAKIPSLY